MALSDNRVMSSAQVGADTSTDPILYLSPDLDSTSRRSLHLDLKEFSRGDTSLANPLQLQYGPRQEVGPLHLTSHVVIQAAV